LQDLQDLQDLQHDPLPGLAQASLPPLQQQLAFAQELPPPLVMTQEVMVKRVALEATMMTKLRSYFMAFSFVLPCPRCASWKLGEVFFRIFLELGDAWLATEFDLLVAVDLCDHFAHRAEFVVGDEAVIERVGLGGEGRREEECREGDEC
jgi:hypothetical protein